MITVVIPVKNRAELVKRTLQSIANQTVAPTAVILVDNGSADGTLHVLQQWAANHPNTTVISELDEGASAARNAGLAIVSTPYVMFFDSDDIMPPRHIEQVVEGLKNNNYPSIAAFNLVLIDTHGKKHPKPFRHGDPMEMHLFHTILSTQRCVISTELAQSIGGWNETLPVWNDWEFGVRLLKSHPHVAYFPLDQPVEAYAQTESITDIAYNLKHGLWEKTLNAVDRELEGTKYHRIVDYRRAILAGEYRQEGHSEYSKGLTHGVRMHLIERYVSLGGRGVALLYKIFC